MWSLVFLAGGALALAFGLREVALLVAVAGGLFHTLVLKPAGACVRGRFSGCEVVLASPYAAPLGVPLQYLGALWFVVAPLAHWFGFGLFWAVVGLVGIAALVGLEVKLRAFCLYCTIAHGLGLVVILALV
ncbi:Vitamin K epoxide reductase [Pyrobaculum islandicum DSM 4184]|uniref:Vitamin K epoxide reductase n=1 Tax=Pyrobaculum islandicum (strain DSM 4184 / JCM 9189 / GEO3) TaxID=384616 RepID=A1RVC9_PYRIL|nr:vitamin K epoxide reductase family protein [Pyrobaculum islandicum]ABL88911.1 Vitamin K epoxide reductase [Pyrobaculum islandicum DSM 4184]